MVTVPKAAAFWLGVNWPAVAFTVSNAGLLVALPVALLTTTLNSDPSSDALVAGVERRVTFWHASYRAKEA